MGYRARSIDLAFPLVLLAGALVAAEPPVFVRIASIEVPMTGTSANPCTGEDLVFGGTADVQARATPAGDGVLRVYVRADLAGGEAVSPTGTRYDLSGFVEGAADALGPLPTTIEVEAEGVLASAASAVPLAATFRLQLTVEADGRVVPTGAAEVRSLECATS